jgi:hypothetical protein
LCRRKLSLGNAGEKAILRAADVQRETGAENARNAEATEWRMPYQEGRLIGHASAR